MSNSVRHGFSGNPRGRFAGMLIFLALFTFSTCSSPTASAPATIDKLYETDTFKAYWYSGKAEVNAYKLDQSRYGEQREGSAILIFVTEDFSKSKHVKLDDPLAAGEDKVSVLKMNFTKNFVTGIYPYSMMLSVFRPVNGREFPHALKVSMSAQEWCGQVFSQVSLTGGQYVVTGHSYFEKEGEEEFSLERTWLEDELWNQIRLAPEDLPLGNVRIIPGLFFARLKHTDLKPLQASVSRADSTDHVYYLIDYPEASRKLAITYQKEFPHRILGWEETFEERGQTMRSSAALDRTLVTDYWTKNRNEFQFLRDSLGLSHHNF